jgi:hypothetical protein
LYACCSHPRDLVPLHSTPLTPRLHTPKLTLTLITTPHPSHPFTPLLIPPHPSSSYSFLLAPPRHTHTHPPSLPLLTPPHPSSPLVTPPHLLTPPHPFASLLLAPPHPSSHSSPSHLITPSHPSSPTPHNSSLRKKNKISSRKEFLLSHVSCADDSKALQDENDDLRKQLNVKSSGKRMLWLI